jgi:hypothetical protein
MRPVLRIVLCVAGAAGVTGSDTLEVRAQFPAVNTQIRAATGQSVSPVYEGWYHGTDGLVYASFGYFNRNTAEVTHVPVGPENKVEPGAVDQGQPTRFFPGRQIGVFAVQIPKGSKNEAVWTVTVQGRSLAIPSSFDQQYLIEPFKEMGGSNPGNTPPTLRFASDGPQAQGPAGVVVSRTAKVGVPLPLDAWLVDDGLPPPRPRPANPPAPKPATGAPPSATVARALAAVPGLSVTWSQYRGAGTVAFANATPPLEKGKASTTVTFKEPGEYMLRALASDGSSPSAQCCWTNGYVKVTVAGQ